MGSVLTGGFAATKSRRPMTAQGRKRPVAQRSMNDRTQSEADLKRWLSAMQRQSLVN
jgi:hypothetical protein